MSKEKFNAEDVENRVVQLKALIDNAVVRECRGKKKIGCVYSSGIDSAVITLLASRACDIIAYSVGGVGSEDLKYARRSQKDLGFEIRIIDINEEETEKILPDLIKIIGTTEPLKVSVGVPLYFAAREAKKDGVSVMLSGQGGDELFGGYNRYLALAAKDRALLKAAMQKDVENAYIDNLDRDIAICKAFDIFLRFPYMDEDFGKCAGDIPTELKVCEIDGNAEEEFECVDLVEGGKRFIRKYLLRHLAADIGLPKYILDRKKKAAQYGSESQKLIEKLAKKRGFKKKAAESGRTDYVRMYLESLA